MTKEAPEVNPTIRTSPIELVIRETGTAASQSRATFYDQSGNPRAEDQTEAGWNQAIHQLDTEMHRYLSKSLQALDQMVKDEQRPGDTAGILERARIQARHAGKAAGEAVLDASLPPVALTLENQKNTPEQNARIRHVGFVCAGTKAVEAALSAALAVMLATSQNAVLNATLGTMESKEEEAISALNAATANLSQAQVRLEVQCQVIRTKARDQ